MTPMKLETARRHDFKIYPHHLKSGLNYHYPMCCILYFQYTHPIMKYAVPELQKLKYRTERIMCPDCIERTHYLHKHIDALAEGLNHIAGDES